MENKIICPNCFKKNDVHKFCIYCGHIIFDDEKIKLYSDNIENKIICPNCFKKNDVHKFCIYCGHEILDDEKIKLYSDNKIYCLNCGRPVKKGQQKCDCGYEFKNLRCPNCSAINPYTNRFCTECGDKVWTSVVSNKNYDNRTSDTIIKKNRFPYDIMHNTILYSRYKLGFQINFPNDLSRLGDNIQNLQSKKPIIDNHLNEILSRWKIISPNYCINCFNIIKPEEYICKKCNTHYVKAKKRIENIQHEQYIKPVFDITDLKWNSKFNENYLNSLTPDIGESLFEYRERLRWEFSENSSLKKSIINKINNIREEEERRRREEERRQWEMEYIRQYGGGYCDSSCSYLSKEYINSNGESVRDPIDIIGDRYVCSLKGSPPFGKFCKDYK